MEAKAKGGY
jgi:branched-subunit amino acid aminotransferase/4-amino-4-deoxychorismate lyase